jgi:thiol-disulfide isomerase/thioredoxin
MPSLARLEKQLGGKDFAVVAIAIDRASRDKVRAFLEETNAQALKIYTDQSMRSARAFGAVGLPTTFLVDRQGREVGRLIGPAEWDAAGALALIRHVIAEK